ncbi:MAG: RNA polymerase sigma factor [Planctomycetota bacterium]
MSFAGRSGWRTIMNEEVERALIARIQAGDQNAYNELFEAHQQRIIHLALQILRNEDSALDIAQEVFLRIFEELPKWRGEARVSTWLYRTTLNVCFEHIRAEKKQHKIRSNITEPLTTESSENGVLDGEIMAVIDEAVKQLPPRQRAIFAMKQYQNLRFFEIAKLLDITEGGAKASYHKALLSLRERLQDYAPELVQGNF